MMKKKKMATLVSNMRRLLPVLLCAIFAACNPLEEKATLAAPSDVKVAQTGLTTVRLTWTNNSTSYDGVILERANDTTGETFAELTRLGKGVLIYNDKNHDGDANYQYRLTTYLGSEKTTVSDFLILINLS